MHLISNADLKAMGFSDISKVHVYGTGGRIVREALSADMPDDLPMIRSKVTSKGLLFFGTDNISWNPDNNPGEQHTLNPYSDESYYFVSDRVCGELPETPAIRSGVKGSNILSSFEERMVHERDLAAASERGRILLGEDFRTTNSQTFNFTLTDIASPTVSASIRFGAKTTNGRSELKISANGTTLSSTGTDRIQSASDEFVRITLSNKTFQVEGDKLALKIDYSYTGALFTARLDYIELFYNRKLTIPSDSQLYFYHNFSGETVELQGCSGETEIWDVTNPHAAAPVEYSLEGSAAYFTPASGYREFIAFNPAAGRPITRAGSVKNQNLHAIPTPDMVIISPDEYLAGARSIAALHEEIDGFKVEILSPDPIYNEFSGGHLDVSAFRKLLKMWHDQPGERTLKYCLILGKPCNDPKIIAGGGHRVPYVPVPIWQDPTGVTEVAAFSTDDYYGMLDDCTEVDFVMGSAKIRVPVGRLPVKTAAEANDMARKIANYVKKPVYGPWRSRVMLIADDQNDGLHLSQTEIVHSYLRKKAPHYQYEKLYLDSYPLESTSIGNTYPKAKERMIRLFNEGVIYTNYIGHGSPSGLCHEKLILWNDINSFSNTNLTFLIAATCSFGYWDSETVSGAEVLVLNPTAGFIGAITPSRTSFMSPNGTLNTYLASHLLATAEDGKGTSFGDAYMNAKNSFRDDNKLRYCLMADPALRIPKPEYTIDIESIDGTDLATAAELPQIAALSKVEVTGNVTRGDGSYADDFNGTLSLDLYDAEIVIETYGNGTKGKKMMYNDRKAKLASASAKVTEGKWSATLMLPAEIANNMSPARIVAYAWSEQGIEAGGSTESFYVAGYPDEESSDTEGPKITELYLNKREFTEGSMVNSNPVLHASFYDESGINISDTGIGHKMSVSLDGDKIFDDVYTCYTPDPENPLGGSIAYPIQDLSAGEHTLKFTVYDNANNATSKSIVFNVAQVIGPSIRDLYTDVNPASTAVIFTITVDNPNTGMNCDLEVFDLSGKRVWSSDRKVTSDVHGVIDTPWDLCDTLGRRVARGIYLYRATLQTSDGRHASKTGKLAVTAQ